MIRNCGATETVANPSSRQLAIAAIVIAALLTYFYFARYPVATSFFFSIASYVAIAMMVFLLDSSLVSHRQTRHGDASAKMLVAVLGIAVLLAFVTECLTLIGAPISTPLALSDWSKKRLLIFFLLFVAIQTLYLFRVPDKDILARSDNLLHMPACGQSLGLMFVSVGIFVGIALILSGFIGSSMGVVPGRLAFFVLVSLAGIAVIALFSLGIMRCPETVFLSLCLLAGSFLVFALPPVTAISWDDEIHYDRALGLSYLGHSEFSEADRLLVHKPWAAIDLDFDTVRDYVDITADAAVEADEFGDFHETIGFATPVRGVTLADVSTIGYFPSAIALWLGRLFQLPFPLYIIVGRLGNLISYAIVIAFAIRVSPQKKGVMAAIGLLPTSVFLASNYSYDPVVISFLMLAVALILRELSSPEKPITEGSMLPIISTLFIGLAPKAIYFPIIGLMFLMPKSKFASTKGYRAFISIVIVFGLVMVCSFALPMLFSAEAQTGDLRGGTDVSASGQISNILSHPIEYVRVLGTFMLGYLSPLNTDMCSVSYAYMGYLPVFIPWISSVSFVCLISVALIDASSEFKRVLGAWGKAWSAFLFIISVVLVCTALYVSFTPVGHETINGCQARYLIPLLICIILAVPSFNIGKGVMTSSAGDELCLGCPASVKFAGAAMFLLLTLCSLNLVVFW